MNDAFITALNTQKATVNWMDVLTENMTNIYTPGFKENQVNFQTFIGGAILDIPQKNLGQGKSTPGTSNSNLFLEGQGYFVVKNSEGKSIYTRHGEFTFDKEGVYKNKDGNIDRENHIIELESFGKGNFKENGKDFIVESVDQKEKWSLTGSIKNIIK